MGSLDHLLALRAFEAAARNGSYVAAARELNVTPAAVGQQVRALEASLGVALFRRSKAGAARLTLTEEAHAVLPDLREGFGRIATALRHLRQDRRRASLTIAVSPAFAALWLLPRLGAFRAAHPQVDLRLDIADASADYTRAGIDLGVRFGPGRWDGFAASLLSDDEVFPVCAPALLDGPRPLRTPADLGGHTLVHDTTVPADAGVPDWRAWLATASCEGIDAANGLRVNATAAAVQAAVAGQGVALGRGLLVADDLAAGRLSVRLPTRACACAGAGTWSAPCRPPVAQPTRSPRGCCRRPQSHVPAHRRMMAPLSICVPDLFCQPCYPARSMA